MAFNQPESELGKQRSASGRTCMKITKIINSMQRNKDAQTCFTDIEDRSHNIAYVEKEGGFFKW